MKIMFLALLGATLLLSCTPTGAPSAEQVAAAQKIAGQYQGTTPCADCEGIEYLITLNSDFTYLGAMVYRGKDAQPVPLTGKWSFVANNKIKLDLPPPAAMHQFEIVENQLILLDQQGQRVTGDLADRYILWREGFAPAPSADAPGDANWNEQKAAGVDFYALGTEPFWGLELDFDRMMRFFPMTADSIETPAMPGQMQDGTLTYEAITDAGTLKVAIRREACSDGMSERNYDYSVVVTTKAQTYKGCGILLAGSLGSYWTLQSIDGTEPDGKVYAKGLPVLQVDVLNNKYGGTDGCNMLHGRVVREGAGKINFTDPVMTRMACAGDAPKQYLEALLAVTEYQLGDKKLTLLVAGKPKLVYGLR